MTVQEEVTALPPAKLSIDQVSKSYRLKHGVVPALERVSLQVTEGEFVCLVGPSGCGKSTLLNLGDLQAHALQRRHHPVLQAV